jgi:hypothetical protein
MALVRSDPEICGGTPCFVSGSGGVKLLIDENRFIHAREGPDTNFA